MTDEEPLRSRLRGARGRLGWALMVMVLIALGALALVGFLGFLLGPRFFLLGGTVAP